MGKLFFLVLSLICTGLFAAQETSRIEWVTSYNEALQKSKSSGKPVILFFTGSDWCGYCHKLEKEVLNTPEFADLAASKFVFMVLDFPMYKPADPKFVEQNKQLQNKFNVKGYPTLVIIDSNEQQIGVAPYRTGGAKAYADFLLNMVNEYNQYQQKVKSVDKNNTSSTDLKKLYLKAHQLGRNDEAKRLVVLGLDTDEKIFFHLEKFKNLAQEGQIRSPQALALKNELKALDPNNEKGTEYEIALIEFEAYSDELAHEKTTPEQTVVPLINYIQTYGEHDKEHVWKLQMIISQVFLDKNKLSQALEYARASYETAPDPVKSEIATAVKNIQIQIKK